MKKVLVVDDELDICILLKKYLEKFGAEADYSISLGDALNRSTTGGYNLYIIDLNLSGASGYDLLEKLRERNLKTKVIMISAHDTEAENAILRGADYFVAKPLSKLAINKALEYVNFTD